eukprot:jgi/Undpi1/6611/HiC_scaffold_20.g09090.m1
MARQAGRERLAVKDMRCVSAVMLLLLGVVTKVSAWSARPSLARIGRGSLELSATTYAEYMKLRKDQDGPEGGADAEGAGTPAAAVSAGEGGVTEVAASAAATVTTSTESATEEPKTAPSAGIEAAAPAPVGGEGEGEGKGLEVEKEVVVEVKAEAAVEVVAEEKEKEEEAPIVVESRTVQLSKRVGEEAAMATSRSRRMSDLSSELKRSFAKKEEVENVIASEISQLSLKLQQERDIEIDRETELRGLLKEFDETIAEKQELIEREQDLLAQMQALRGQVEEASIRAPIEAAMAKKADVTSIEVMLLEDLFECKEKLEKELVSTSSRADTMNGVVAALPSQQDTARMRAYNWQDVEDLQEVLLSSVEDMEASDAQVASLRTRLLDSVEQKKEVLGEVSSTTEIVRDGADGAAKKISAGRAFKVSKELSEKELVEAVAESSKSAAVGVAKSVVAGVTSLGSYAKSPEAQDVAASTVDVIGAISGAASSIGDAFKEAKKEYDDNSLSGEEMTSVDKIFKSVRSGVKAVQNSPTVKTKLDEAGELVTKTLPSAGGRVGKGAAQAFKGAAANDDIGNPVREALDSVEKFIVSMAALGSKFFTNSKAAYFQLPGGDKAPKKLGGGTGKSSSPPAADSRAKVETPASAPAAASTESSSPAPPAAEKSTP